MNILGRSEDTDYNWGDDSDLENYIKSLYESDVDLVLVFRLGNRYDSDPEDERVQ